MRLNAWHVGSADDPSLHFLSLVDLVSIVPFYVDLFYVGDLPASQFLRMFRLFRMMRVEGRYVEAFTLFDDVFREQKSVLITAGFVGLTTWVIVASLYYVTEHRSTSSIYCSGTARCSDIEVDTSKCSFDQWGFVNCTAGGCPSTPSDPHPCWNLFQSIPGAMFFSMLNLFGEFPLIDDHSVGGKFVATFTAVLAVAVFGIPTGILGNGFDDLLARRRKEREAQEKLERRKIAQDRLHTGSVLASAANAFGGMPLQSTDERTLVCVHTSDPRSLHSEAVHE